MSLLFSTGVIAASGLAKGAPGMVLLTPTSIAHSGTSASIGANGQVTFTAVTSLSLNGVFSADFDNYVISAWHSSSSGTPYIYIRMRANGTDNSGASTYVYQMLIGDGSVSASRTTSNTAVIASSSHLQRSGAVVHVYGPFLAQPTAMRGVSMNGGAGAQTYDNAATHNQSTSYDGFTIYPDTGPNLTGKLAVYGVRS